jgi:hypothetical protein
MFVTYYLQALPHAYRTVVFTAPRSPAPVPSPHSVPQLWTVHHRTGRCTHLYVSLSHDKPTLHNLQKYCLNKLPCFSEYLIENRSCRTRARSSRTRHIVITGCRKLNVWCCGVFRRQNLHMTPSWNSMDMFRKHTAWLPQQTVHSETSARYCTVLPIQQNWQVPCQDSTKLNLCEVKWVKVMLLEITVPCTLGWTCTDDTWL